MPEEVKQPSLTAQSEKPQHYQYLKEFRVEPCPLFKQHQCNQHRPYTCFYWHFQNQRRRRPVRRRDGTLNYSPDIYCSKYDENTGVCPDGEECPYLHRVAGDVERKYHLRYYKTCLCVHGTDSKGNCVKNGASCAFAHGLADLRQPVYDIREVMPGAELPAEWLESPRTTFIVEDPVWQDTAYVLANYKTEVCKKPPRLCRQGYACPFYHNNKDKRRPPRNHKYRSTPCPNVKHGDEWGDPEVCDQGEQCSYCHTRTEQQFHPEIYKSTKCNDMLQHGYCPRSVFCAFAHSESDSAQCADREVALRSGTSLVTIVSKQLDQQHDGSGNQNLDSPLHKTQFSPVNGVFRGPPPSCVDLSAPQVQQSQQEHLPNVMDTVSQQNNNNNSLFSTPPPPLPDRSVSDWSKLRHVSGPAAGQGDFSIQPPALSTSYPKAIGAERERQWSLTEDVVDAQRMALDNLRNSADTFFNPQELEHLVDDISLEDLHLLPAVQEKEENGDSLASSLGRQDAGGLSSGVGALYGTSAPVTIPGAVGAHSRFFSNSYGAPPRSYGSSAGAGSYGLFSDFMAPPTPAPSLLEGNDFVKHAQLACDVWKKESDELSRKLDVAERERNEAVRQLNALRAEFHRGSGLVLAQELARSVESIPPNRLPEVRMYLKNSLDYIDQKLRESSQHGPICGRCGRATNHIDQNGDHCAICSPSSSPGKNGIGPGSYGKRF